MPENLQKRKTKDNPILGTVLIDQFLGTVFFVINKKKHEPLRGALRIIQT